MLPLMDPSSEWMLLLLSRLRPVGPSPTLLLEALTAAQFSLSVLSIRSAFGSLEETLFSDSPVCFYFLNRNYLCERQSDREMKIKRYSTHC